MPVQTKLTRLHVVYTNGASRIIRSDNPNAWFSVKQEERLLIISKVTQEDNSTYSAPMLLISTNILQDLETIYTEVEPFTP